LSDKFLSLPDVLSRTSLKRSTVYERIKLRSFPSPISLGGRRVAWLESEVDAWISARVKTARNGDAA
jgi:prophage regulatory protein